MVGHTHHDYLNETTGDENAIRTYTLDLAQIKDFTEERELFDTSGNYFRKVNLSYLDEHLDDINDWHAFISRLVDIDCLYIINDRLVSNQIMRDYGEELNLKYIARLKQDGIKSVII